MGKKIISCSRNSVVIVLLANLGLNIWLKTRLPKYIKNNTDYKVSYKSLDVDLLSGIFFRQELPSTAKTLKISMLSDFRERLTL
jgi:hypothetical protein